jgi:glycosyltransferase involved in cell wall biosynthesis
MKLSVVIPAYNEEKTIKEIISRVKAVDLSRLDVEKEIIVIDDGSTDSTRELLKTISGITYIFHEKNLGKGGSVKTGFKHATGDIVLIQDADLEYDPNEYSRLIQPILGGNADVVYGSRFLTHAPHRVLYFHHYLANRALTFFSNIFTNLNLSDMETGFKVFHTSVINRIQGKLVSKRFGIEPELTARIAKLNIRVYEVGISYYGRSYAEGKKIRWSDGLAAIWHIIRFNMFS